MRFRTFAAWAVAVLVLGLAGCGSAAPTEGSGGADQDQDFHVTVPTPYGDVELTERPERIVVLSLDYLEATLALDLTPVGAPTGVPLGDWVTERIDTTDTDIFAFSSPSNGEVPMEKIAALDPDLILGSVYAVTQENFDELSKIAPTLTHADDADETVAGAWEDITRQVGTATGTSDKADQVIAGVHQKITEAQEAAPNSQGTKAIFAGVAAQGIAVTQGDAHSGMRLLQALGLEQTDVGSGEEGYGGGRVMLSTEEIGQLDKADLLIIGAIDPAAAEQLFKNELYTSLDIVKEDHVLVLDALGTWSFNTPTALNVPYLIDQLQPLMEGVG